MTLTSDNQAGDHDYDDGDSIYSQPAYISVLRKEGEDEDACDSRPAPLSVSGLVSASISTPSQPSSSSPSPSGSSYTATEMAHEGFKEDGLPEVYLVRGKLIVVHPAKPGDPLEVVLREREPNDPLKNVLPGLFAESMETRFQQSSACNKAFATFIRNAIWRGVLQLNFKAGFFEQHLSKTLQIRGIINFMMIQHSDKLDSVEITILSKLGRLYARAIGQYSTSVSKYNFRKVSGEIDRLWLLQHDARETLEDLVHMFVRDKEFRDGREETVLKDGHVADLSPKNQPDLASLDKLFIIVLPEYDDDDDDNDGIPVPDGYFGEQDGYNGKQELPEESDPNDDYYGAALRNISNISSMRQL